MVRRTVQAASWRVSIVWCLLCSVWMFSVQGHCCCKFEKCLNIKLLLDRKHGVRSCTQILTVSTVTSQLASSTAVGKPSSPLGPRAAICHTTYLTCRWQYIHSCITRGRFETDTKHLVLGAQGPPPTPTADTSIVCDVRA